jgi:hypothetical protein
MTITPAMLHALCARFDPPLTGREVHALLKLHQVQINERQVRHYMTGKSQCPDSVFRAWRDVVSELETITDSEFAAKMENLL